MLDKAKPKTASQTATEGPPADFQAHLQALEASGRVPWSARSSGSGPMGRP